ncbi:MAG TPA: hypothetical protein VI728_09790 [Syntrophales bacterium]|nr:hypothetical protein [Syntrophales bacterium]
MSEETLKPFLDELASLLAASYLREQTLSPDERMARRVRMKVNKRATRQYEDFSPHDL